jgi:5-formyltetrahydrofolate cyclo-ligase
MNPQQQKRALRRAVVEAILALDPAERLRQEQWLTEQFPTLPGFDRARTVMLYVTAFPEEIQTRSMLHTALSLGKRVVCPRVDRAAGELLLYHVQDLETDLVPGTLGIPEPRMDLRPAQPGQVDWILVPGLGFDDRGYRLGRGAGHYDRLLPRLAPDALRWSLILDAQWIDALPVEPHDIPLDGIVSPSKRFERG